MCEDWVWVLPILWEQGVYWACVRFGCGGVSGIGGVWGLYQGMEGDVMLCLCEL